MFGHHQHYLVRTCIRTDGKPGGECQFTWNEDPANMFPMREPMDRVRNNPMNYLPVPLEVELGIETPEGYYQQDAYTEDDSTTIMQPLRPIEEKVEMPPSGNMAPVPQKEEWRARSKGPEDPSKARLTWTSKQLRSSTMLRT